MTTPASLIQPPAFTILGGGVAPGIPQVFPLYTLGGTDSERLDSVYMEIDWPGNDALSVVLGIQLVAPNGKPIGVYVSSPILGVDDAPLISYLNWSRLGNDTDQLDTREEVFAVDAIRRAWTNTRLPDIVLPPLSSINLVVWLEDGEEGAAVPVDQPTITTTRNAGAVSSTTALDLTPYLLPAAVG